MQRGAGKQLSAFSDVGEFRTRRARHGYVGPTDAVEWPQARMLAPRAICRW